MKYRVAVFVGKEENEWTVTARDTVIVDSESAITISVTVKAKTAEAAKNLATSLAEVFKNEITRTLERLKAEAKEAGLPEPAEIEIDNDVLSTIAETISEPAKKEGYEVIIDWRWEPLPPGDDP